MSVKSGSSLGEPSGGEVIRMGYLKKLKTMRKKFFVLRAESLESSARLEYYDNEKKYRQNQNPKRSIPLKACFNINKRIDTKYKYVIALYTKDDCFCVVLDSDKDLEEWLKSLLSLQRGEDVMDGEPPRPTFEHVWQVQMLNKGLGSSRNIKGAYHLCLTEKTLSLVRKNVSSQVPPWYFTGQQQDHVEFSLMSIRRCGHSDCFFYMEVGRSSITGAGELWMQTEDTNIAQNMDEVILRAMSNNNSKEELGPKLRNRSSSATEASKPILVQRRQTHTGAPKLPSYCSPSSQDVVAAAGTKPGEQQGAPMHQESGTSTSTAIYHNTSTSNTALLVSPQPQSCLQRNIHRPSERRHSVSAGGVPAWCGIAHHQRTQSLPLAPLPTTTTTSTAHNVVTTTQQQQQQHFLPQLENNNPAQYLPNARNNNKPRVLNNNSQTSNRCMTGGRERCDSMPSRARTSSEGVYPSAVTHGMRSHLMPHRPQSLYAREVSHSPPAGSPASPASAACSTDSAGSSLSIDEPDAWIEYPEVPMGRYGHSLTPDEPIAEENCDEGTDNPYVSVSPNGSPLTGGYVPMAPLSSDDGYVDMSPRGRHTEMSPAASTCSITSGTPSTDMRFSEYHLEKVSSYFTPSEEDDTSSAERPIRAYSVGSRPEASRFKSKLEHGNHGMHDNARVRAFSVGSRSKGLPNRILPPHGQPPSTGAKSSSAPLLNQNSQFGSHSSMEPMDDLMEMDFSKPGGNTGYVDMSPRSRGTPAGYVEMKPGISENTPTTPDLPYMDMRPSVSPMKLSNMSLHSEPPREHPYVDMRPTSSPMKPSTSPLQCPVSSRDSSAYMDMRPSTSPHKPSSIPKYNPYYVEMSGNKLGSSPKSTKTASPIQEEYMDMDFNPSRNVQLERTFSGAARTQPVDLPHPKKSPEGYMEMAWGKHQRKSSLDSTKVSGSSSEDYVNMSAKRKERRGSKKEKTRSQPITIQSNRNSQNIPTSKIVTSQSPVSSFSTYTQSPGRKNSTGTSPKHPPSFLPLVSSSYSPGSSPFSSLRRPRSRKSSRRDSKDSSGLVTPTSDQSTIFPFSPGSPVKPFHMKSPDLTCSRKCAVDASSGTVKIANTAGKPPQSGSSDYTRMNYDFSSKSSDYLEMGYDNPKTVVFQSEKVRTTPHLNQTDSDYINFCPAAPRPKTNSSSSDDYGEYAVMRPTNTIATNQPRKSSIPFANIHTTITKQLSGLNVSNMKPCVFKPIVEPRDENRLGTVSPRPGDIAPHRSYENLRSGTDSATEETSRSDSLEGNYETLRGGSCISPVAKISRPNSVNSDLLCRSNSRPGSVSSDKSNVSRPSSVSSEVTKGTLSRPSSVSSELGSTSSTIVGSRPESVNAEHLTRPSSVSSEQLNYASLDLAPTDDDGTKSPRTGKSQNDSTRSPTPSSSTEPCFTYAEIDFIKSEGLKQANILNNTKIKH